MAFHDPTEHIQTREAFDAEVQALAARALRTGEYPRLIETPITTVEQITDDVLDQLAGAAPVNPEDVEDWSVERGRGRKDTVRPPRFLTEELLQKWRKERASTPSERRKALLERRDPLRETLTKLVRRGHDVSTIINTLDRARWDFLLLAVRRGHPDRPRRSDRVARLKARAERALMAPVDVLTELVILHTDGQVLSRRGPGALDDLVADSGPARAYLTVLRALKDARRALQADRRLQSRPLPTSNRNPPHQMLLGAVRETLHGLGVSYSDITILLHASGLLALTRAARLKVE